MKQFLSQVADHFFLEGNISSKCFIFPNRRSLAFFKKYLSQTIAGCSDAPVIAPDLLTMNDFFYRVAGGSPTGRVRLLLELYACYERLNPHHESLDDFIFWGDVLLSDFNDVDKYLVDPRQLFTNVADLKSIQDSYSYLSDTQREAIDHFLSHFKSGDRLTVDLDSENPDVKARFLRIWDILFSLYTDYNSSLAEQGLSYEGMVYRSLADRLDSEAAVDIMSAAFPEVDGFIFVGLNALNECEKKVMARMRDAGIARFCWDWDAGGWMSDPQNKSTVFMKANLSAYPQAFTLEQVTGTPKVNVLSVPSSIGQAKQLGAVLGHIAAERGMAVSSLGLDTAVVLPDEALLLPVLNSIPSEITGINVTMGYPMGSSALFDLVSSAATMQLHLRRKDGEWLFYHKQAYSVFSNGIFKNALSEAGRAVVDSVKAAAQYYIPQSSLTGDPVLEAVFRPVVSDPKAADAAVVKSFGEYIAGIILAVVPSLKQTPDLVVELDFARGCYQAVNSLRDMELPVLPSTYVRLLMQLMNTVSVPFNGEPLKGLQIMGPLETRALDFDNLVILSSNEGVFPRRSVSSSFIPPELRKVFGLPTYEYQDAVWAYYFYRMISRARTVWMIYDSRTEGVKSGEESRYIKQLELHFRAGVTRLVAEAPIVPGGEEQPIGKTPEDIETVKGTYLSASALQNYLYCPAKFYYHTVKKLQPEDDVAESLDAGMIGNVFHNTMLALYFGPEAMDPSFPLDRKSLEENEYRRQRYVTREYIEEWMGRPAGIKSRIRSLIMAELRTFEVSGRNLVFEDVVFQYVMKVLERDLECMETYGCTAFETKGLELKCFWEYGGFKFIGFIDRLDSFRRDELRVVDYKTGKVEDNDIMIFDDNAQSVVDALFGEDNSKRPKIALQLFLYDMFVTKDIKEGVNIANSIYSPAGLFVSAVQTVPSSPEFIRLMKERLLTLLNEISDPSVPFSRTQDRKTCEYCDFKNICGR